MHYAVGYKVLQVISANGGNELVLVMSLGIRILHLRLKVRVLHISVVLGDGATQMVLIVLVVARNNERGHRTLRVK